MKKENSNRIIKFRAWYRGEKPEMVKVGSIEFFTNGTYLINDELPIRADGLMQFTGLKDKNGKEIYEEDIVKVAKHNNLPYEVRWWINGWSILDESQVIESLCDWGTPGLEVIGNIYENPDLLNKE